MKRHLFLVVLVGTLLISGCSQVQGEEPIENKEDSPYQKQIQELKIENGELKIENMKLKEEIRNLEKSIRQNSKE